MDIWDRIEENLTKVNIEPIAIFTKPKKAANTTKFTVKITPEGTYIKTDMLDGVTIKKIKKYFTLSDKTIMGYYKYTSLWRQVGKRLYIPRFGSLLLRKKYPNIQYISSIVLGNPLSNMVYNETNKDNQTLIYEHIMQNQFSDTNRLAGQSGLILNEKAGRGKTFLAMYIMGILKCRTLIIVHNTTMLDQWVEILTKGFTGVTIGQYYGKKKIQGDIMVGVINSLAGEEFTFADKKTKTTTKLTPREFYSGFDFVILDECHMFYSEKRRVIYDVCHPTYMLGLSATPDKDTDSSYKVGHYSIGPVMEAFSLPNYNEDSVPFVGNVTKVAYAGPPEYTEHMVTESTGITSVPLLIAQICDDPYRLQMVVNTVREQYTKGLNVLVFADRRSYLQLIQAALDIESHMLTNEEEHVKLQSINLMGGSKKDEIDDAEKNKNVILATYQFLGTGVSIQKLNSIVLTTPRKTQSEQFIKRIFRTGSDYSITREIIDIVDTKISLKSQWSERKAYYDKEGFPITVKKIVWKNITL
jgi:superfamily II DNA or RNA helicase